MPQHANRATKESLTTTVVVFAKEDGIFTYGWTKPITTQNIDKLSEINEPSRLIFGTGAVMKQEGEDWMINVPNGRYDVKIALKLVDTPDTVQIFPPHATSAMKFTLNNELQEPTPLVVHDQLILDKPFVLVNESEIRLKWVEGYVSLIWIEIVPLNAPPENAGQTVEYSSRSKVGANCFKEPLN